MSQANQTKLWQYYYDTLAKGVDLGYNPKPEMYDPKLAHSLKYDIAKFSAFKETSFRKQIESALTKDGKIVPWSEFKKTADDLNIEYNRRWLKTEYNHTVATANMAQQWQSFEADKDLYPNLKYVTANDGRVREAHKILDGTILPIDHPFWKSHTTPLDWGCRCTVEQTDEQPNKVIPSYQVKEEFQNNAFYSTKVFNGSAYEKELTANEIKANQKIAKENFDRENNVKLERYKNFEFAKQKRIINGGVFEKYTTGSQNKIEEAKNINTIKLLANKGYKYRLLPVIDDGLKNPDCYNLQSFAFSDIKNSISDNGKSIIQNALKEANAQGATELIVNLKVQLKNSSEIYKGIVATIKQKRAKRIEKIILINAKNEVREFDLIKFRKYFNKKG